MPEKAWYKEWFNSPYYYTLYRHRNAQEAAHFIEKLIEHLQPLPNSKMADAACGKGRHSKILAELGYDVTGFDLAEEAIKYAKQFEKDNLHFFQHDMRLPFWMNYFDYAFNFFTSFGYFRTLREHDNAIRTIAQSLKSNGVFVMDYLNVRYTEAHLVKSEQKTLEGVKFRIARWQDEEHFFKQIQIEDNGMIKHLFTEKVAKFTLGNFTEMFAYHGLQIQEVFGDYHFAAFNIKKSPRLIMIAKKVK